MKAKTNSWMRYALCALAAAVALALTVAACMNGQAAAASRIDETRAFVGDDGLVYGVPFEGDDGLIVMPDMTRVRATNGKYGYISVEEMHAAIVDYATTEEERLASIRNVASMRAPALAHATEEYFGAAALTSAELSSLADGLHRGGGYQNAQATYAELAAEPLAQAINQGAVNREVAIALVSEYVRTEESADIARFVEGAEGSAEASEAEAVKAYAAAIVDNRGVDPVTPNEVIVTPAIFEAVYEIAKAELAVPIPVYAADGTTVVGTCMVDRM